MSLIAWYPLNGDTLDYSGNGNHAFYSNALIDNNGKIGKCYSFNGTSTYISTTSMLNSIEDFSVSFWCKRNDVSINQGFFCARTAVGSGLSLFYLSSSGLRFDTGINYQWVTGYVPPIDEWIHLTLIKTSTRKSLYVNGTFYSSASSVGNIVGFHSTFMLGASHTSGSSLGNFLNGYLNDVRVYNHALSEKEINEIYKTKILHYTFDDFQEPTKNLSYDLSTYLNLHYVNRTSHSFVNLNSPISINDNVLKITSSSDDDTSFQFYSNNIPVSASAPYTFSFYSKTDAPNQYWSYQAQGYFKMKWYDSSNNLLSETKPPSNININNDWSRTILTGTSPSNATSVVLSLGNDTPNLPNGRNIWITGVQLEKKNHATPWVRDIREGTVFDISGYNNNYVLSLDNTPTWTEESKIGNGAYKFTPSYKPFICIPDSKCKVTNQITVSAWAYRDNWQSTSSERIISCTETGGWQLGFNDSAGYTNMTCYIAGVGYKAATIPNSSISSGWHHIVGTFDGTNVKIYLDGELKNTVLATGTTIGYNATNGIFIGAEPGSSNTVASSNYWNGLIDDVRIYATALSDEDIKGLYQTKASIDNAGNLYVNNININGIGKSKNLIYYQNWIDGTYNTTQTFSGDIPNSDMLIQSHPNFTNIIGSFVNPRGQLDKMIQYKTDTTHYIQYAHPTSHYYFNIDKSKIYRFSQWIYRHKTSGTSNSQRCYLGVKASSVCDVNTTNVNSNPYFTYPLMNDSLYMDKWVLQVFYIYPYGSTDNIGTGRLYYPDGTSVSIGTNYNWANVTDSYIRQYPMYETGEISEGSFVLHYRPRFEVVDGNEPSINELISLGGHLPLTNNKMSINDKGIGYFKDFSEVGITDGLVGWYPFNGNSNDYSGNKNNGTVYGATITNGINQMAYSFDGIDDYIEVQYSDSFSFVNNTFTITMWVKSDNFGSSYRSPISSMSLGRRFCVNVTNNVLDFSVSGNGTSWDLVSHLMGNNISDDKWHHIACKWDGSLGLGFIYTDSILIGSKGSIGTMYNKNSTIEFCKTVSGQWTKCCIQDVRIYNRSLTSEEIAIQYDLTKENYTAMKMTKDKVYIANKIREV